MSIRPSTSGAAHHGGRQILERRRPALLQGDARFEPQQFQHPLDARLTERAEPPQIRATATARAPSARAFTMSVPRRNPLSIITGMRPPTASMISASA